jgi:hypothetical protein
LKRTIFRHEYKYVLNAFQYEILKPRLKFLKKDPHCEENGYYTVRSLYLEDLKNNSYYEKESGIYNRCKIRFRTYNNCNDFVSLEKKSKVGQLIHKKSIKIAKFRADELLSNSSLLNKTLRKEFPNSENYSALRFYRPKVVIEYQREAYVIENCNNLRINFDKSVSASLDTSHFFQKFPITNLITNSRKIILEVKFTNYLPEHIRFLLSPLDSNLISFSKYAKSISFLN